MSTASDIKLIKAETYHARHGEIENAFRYRFDALIVPVTQEPNCPSALLGVNRKGVFSFHASDHGDGQGLLQYARKRAREHGFDKICDGKTLLIAQPRFLGYVFNPVSFWLFFDKDNNLRVVLAEVNNTFGERHTYLCHHDDFAPIYGSDKITARKLFHVSPFQDVAGKYTFRFRVNDGFVGVWIDLKHGSQGVFASMTGPIKTISTPILIKSAFTRPLGALRVMALIHWQALKLKIKGGKYRRLPPQNPQRISR